jgi:hypothetical protein
MLLISQSMVVTRFSLNLDQTFISPNCQDHHIHDSRASIKGLAASTLDNIELGILCMTPYAILTKDGGMTVTVDALKLIFYLHYCNTLSDDPVLMDTLTAALQYWENRLTIENVLNLVINQLLPGFQQELVEQAYLHVLNCNLTDMVLCFDCINDILTFNADDIVFNILQESIILVHLSDQI